MPQIRVHRRWAIFLIATMAWGCGGGGTAPAPAVTPAARDTVRVTTFGDSNTDIAWSAAEPRVRARSYVSDLGPRLAPGAPNDSEQLAGLVEARWRAIRATPIRASNHGIAATHTGGGGHGGANRNGNGAPNARTLVGGISRFEGEVLGAAIRGAAASQ
ncbi:MAG TPA: hypothetical protein VFJ16_13885 [Longimicrobium sp.]|nr:hypothetical protein [Longimicrobium sp.]